MPTPAAGGAAGVAVAVVAGAAWAAASYDAPDFFWDAVTTPRGPAFGLFCFAFTLLPLGVLPGWVAGFAARDRRAARARGALAGFITTAALAAVPAGALWLVSYQ